MAPKEPTRNGVVVVVGAALLLLAISASAAVTAGTDRCNIANVILVQNRSGEAIVTLQSTLNGAPSSVVTFPSGIPSECGDGFKRCAVTLLRGEGGHAVIVLPLIDGAGLILLESEQLQYNVVDTFVVPYIEGLDCRLTAVFELRASVLGICLNLNDSADDNVFPLLLSVNFDNLTLSEFVIDDSIYSNLRLLLPDSMSEVLLFKDLVCNSFDDFAFFLEDAFLWNFNVNFGVVYEDYDTNFFAECNRTSRVKKISNQKLVAYCMSSTTLVIDVCELETQGMRRVVANIEHYISNINGTPYFCDEHTKVVHNGTTLTLSSDQNGVPDIVVPISSQPEDLSNAECVILPVNATESEAIFTYVTQDGQTSVTSITSNITWVLADTNAQPSEVAFIQQGKFLAVNQDLDSTLFFNLSCSTDMALLTVNHSADLMLATEDNTRPQTCQCDAEDPTVVTTPVPTQPSPTSPSPTTAGPTSPDPTISYRVPVGATLGALLLIVAVLGVSFVIGVIIYRYLKWKRAARPTTPRPVVLAPLLNDDEPSADSEATTHPAMLSQPLLEQENEPSTDPEKKTSRELGTPSPVLAENPPDPEGQSAQELETQSSSLQELSGDLEVAEFSLNAVGITTPHGTELSTKSSTPQEDTSPEHERETLPEPEPPEFPGPGPPSPLQSDLKHLAFVNPIPMSDNGHDMEASAESSYTHEGAVPLEYKKDTPYDIELSTTSSATQEGTSPEHKRERLPEPEPPAFPGPGPPKLEGEPELPSESQAQSTGKNPEAQSLPDTLGVAPSLEPFQNAMRETDFQYFNGNHQQAIVNPVPVSDNGGNTPHGIQPSADSPFPPNMLKTAEQPELELDNNHDQPHYNNNNNQ